MARWDTTPGSLHPGPGWGEAIPRSRLGRVFRPLGKGSLRACVLTLMAAAIGPGAMLLPSVFRLVGMPVGLLCLALAAYCCMQSMRFIISLVYLTGRSSYPAAVSAILGPTAGRALMHLTTFNIILGISAQVKFVTGLMQAALVSSLPTAVPLELVAIAAAFPICVRRDISALRYVTIVAPLALVYVLAMVLFRGLSAAQAQGLALDEPEPTMDPHLVRSGVAGLRGLPQAFSIMVNAMTCHQLAVPMYKELRCAKAQRVNKVVLACMSNLATLYCMVGCVAFLTFGAATPENILLAYPQGDRAALLAQWLVGCTLYIAVPLNVHALRGHLMETLPGAAASLLRHGGQALQAAWTLLFLAVPAGIACAFPDVSAILGVAVGFGQVTHNFVLPVAALCVIRWGRWDACSGMGSSEAPSPKGMNFQDLLFSSPLSTPLLSAGHGSMVSPSPQYSLDSGSSSDSVGLDKPELDLPALGMPGAAAEAGAAFGDSILWPQGLPADSPPELCLPSQCFTPTSRQRLCSPRSGRRCSLWRSKDDGPVDDAQWSSEFGLSLLSLVFGSGLGFSAAFGALMQCMASGA